jgi:two-component system cell cycle sensor histidine kinase/response regulator CckA
LFSRQGVVDVPRSVDLDGLLIELDKMLRRVLGTHVKLETKRNASVWPVLVDRTQIEQVLVNLLVNARDAMPRGGSIVVETHNVELDDDYTRLHPGVIAGDYVMLAVSDTGVGMDAATQARIFEPFFTTKQVGKGTGLGLATVFGIVEKAGGHIFVYSELGLGTTFKVYLPRDRSARRSTTLPPAAREARGDETIMLVEDDATVRTFARRGLSRLGYNVIEASSGEAALEQFDDSIDLLVSDVIMPGMFGPELAAKLHAARPDLKVLFVSGYTENALDERDLVHGKVHFLEKPLSMKRLGEVVRELLDA